MNTISTAVQEVISRLADVKETGSNQWQAKCPAHDDNKPSLSIKQGTDGKVVLHCHAGCSPKNICAAIGIAVADLFQRKGRYHPQPTIVEVYPYHDEDKRLLFEVVRCEPKDFRQRRPDGKGGFVWKLGGVRRVLYRLPELIAAKNADVVYIVEGEKDVNRLTGLGFVATCNPGGAGKWRHDYNVFLKGRRLCVIADRDKAGRHHAQMVARSVHDIAAEVRVVELPGEKVKDASDWIAGGGSAGALQKIVEHAPLWTGSEISAVEAQDLADDNSKTSSQSQALLELARGVELFHNGDTPFATIDVAGHRENHPTNGKAFRAWLMREFWAIHQKPAGTHAMKDAVDTLFARALFEGPEKRVAVRIAELEGATYVDLTSGKPSRSLPMDGRS